jgi:hypothetical protein
MNSTTTIITLKAPLTPLICEAVPHTLQCCGCGSYNLSRSGSVPEDPDSDPKATLMSTTKLTGRENLTKNTFCVGPVGPNDKENQVKIYKKYCLRYITSLKR